MRYVQMTVDEAWERIEEIENKYVIVNVKHSSGHVEPIEMLIHPTTISFVEVATVKDYEANGFDTEGLKTEWIEF